MTDFERAVREIEYNFRLSDMERYRRKLERRILRERRRRDRLRGRQDSGGNR